MIDLQIKDKRIHILKYIYLVPYRGLLFFLIEQIAKLELDQRMYQIPGRGEKDNFSGVYLST